MSQIMASGVTIIELGSATIRIVLPVLFIGGITGRRVKSVSSLNR